MTENFKRKLKFWISILAKVLIITLISIKLISYLYPKEQKPLEKETKKATVLDTVKEVPKVVENEKVEENKTPKKEELYVPIVETIRYKGELVSGAYFTVSGCTECQSSVSGKAGVTTARIPKKIYNNDKEYDFYVYRKDTLLYHKSMRFQDLQFNTVR